MRINDRDAGTTYLCIIQIDQILRGRMSGSDRGGSEVWRPEPKPVNQNKGGAGGQGGGGVADPCVLSEVTNLNSVNAAVLQTVGVGDVLVVDFEPGPPRRLLAKTATGQTVGSITSPSMLQIIQCIATRNMTYVAEVLAINGAICQVKVQTQ
ncbi:hypothetical protein [Trinickia mobilis]|uniref:hypothetical protein n=1 Tax=Trinickia mobilis TaxID=2816356 RepID=UPI001A8FBAE0|nr:hypothetical protein [Trinickia mobilis]